MIGPRDQSPPVKQDDEPLEWNLNMSQIDPNMVTTAFYLPGYRVRQNLGLVRGLVVRSCSAAGSFGAGLQSFFGGEITAYQDMCEQARADAFDRMLKHASSVGANAIIGAHYDATEIADGITEVLAYGTAVFVHANSHSAPA